MANNNYRNCNRKNYNRKNMNKKNYNNKKKNNYYYHKKKDNSLKNIVEDIEKTIQLDTKEIDEYQKNEINYEELNNDINNLLNNNIENSKEEISFENDYVLEEPILKKKENYTKVDNVNELMEIKKHKPVWIYLLGPLLILIAIFGTTYAYFVFSDDLEEEGDISAGLMYVRLTENLQNISLSKYPKTVDEARNGSDNYVDFTIVGKNSSEDNTVTYSFKLENGEDEEGIRINSKYIMFDLYLLDNNQEILLIDGANMDEFNAYDLRNINVIPANTTESEVSRQYRIRAWVSDNLKIGDMEGASYTSGEFSSLYANFKLSINTGTITNSIPLIINKRNSYVENNKNYVIAELSNNYGLSLVGEDLDEDDIVILDITNQENKLYFQYRDERENENLTNQDSLSLTYSFSKNESFKLQIFMISRDNNDANTVVHFRVRKNGNVVDEFDQLVNIKGNNYCINHGITKLDECILVMDNTSLNVDGAKGEIAVKDNPNVNIVPTSYLDNEKTKIDFINSEKGLYKVSDDLGDSYIFRGNVLNNNVLFGGIYWKILRVNGDGSTRLIYNGTTSDATGNATTIGNGVYNNINIGPTSVGYMYSKNNSNILGTSFTDTSWDSDTLYYWGSLSSFEEVIDSNTNLVYWQKKASSTLTQSKLSDLSNFDNAYTCKGTTANATCNRLYHVTSVTDASTSQTQYVSKTWESIATQDDNWSDSAYIWSTFANFEEKEDNIGRYWQLKSPINNDEFITKTLNNMTETDFSSFGYTCKATTTSEPCRILYHVDSRLSSTSSNSHYITNAPNSNNKRDIEANSIDSNIKVQLENWYTNTFGVLTNGEGNRNVKEYIVDNIWCNDRSIGNNYYNSEGQTVANSNNTGYLITSNSTYSGRLRLMDSALNYRSSTLQCTSNNDRFSATRSLGNGQMNYPIGLITLDELALSGSLYNEENSNSFLLTGNSFWTMTPSDYTSNLERADVFYLDIDGSIKAGSVTSSLGIRPVINLDKNTIISGGDGTLANPFTIQ